MTDVKKQNLTKIAIKSSVYNFSTVFVNKIGSLVFTIVLARLLLPELFGVYALTLSIISIIITFTDLGINISTVRYVSYALGKNKKSRARSYFWYLFKLKGIITITVIFITLLTSKYIAYNIFGKPAIFLPLIVGTFYILMESLNGIIGSLFAARKDWSKVPFIELVSQASKIILSVMAILFLSENLRISGILVSFALAGVISLIITTVILFKEGREIFLGKTVDIDKSRVKNYIGFMSVASISIIFFGSVDTLMLGKFVDAEYLGYYRAALGLVISLSALLSFSAILFPIFTQVSGDRLERGFQQTLKYLLILTVPMTFGLMMIAKFAIFAVYGKEYLVATMPLYILALLILIAPLVELYSSIFRAKELVKSLAKFTFISLLINIIFNLVLIKNLLPFGQEYALLGAGLATIVSRGYFLTRLIVKTKHKFNIKINYVHFIKPVLATIVMSFFLFVFNRQVPINILYGLVEIIVGIGIYFGVLWLLKGFDRNDLDLLKNLRKIENLERIDS